LVELHGCSTNLDDLRGACAFDLGVAHELGSFSPDLACFWVLVLCTCRGLAMLPWEELELCVLNHSFNKLLIDAFTNNHYGPRM